MNSINVSVRKTSHANMDSLPLRFGVHFNSDQTLKLDVIQHLGRDPAYPDRFHVEASFRDPKGQDEAEHCGHFVLAQNSQNLLPTLVTVWRGERNTEWGLSNTMTALRRDGFLKVTHLLEMHPLYVAGQLTDSAALLKFLSVTIARKDIARFEEVAEQAKADTARLIKNLEIAREEAQMALNKAERMEKVAHEAINVVEELEVRSTKQQTEIEALRAMIKDGEEKYKQETAAAQQASSVATLSAPDTLVQVNEGVVIRGSSCTVLVLADGTRRHMKTTTFDKDGAITQKAKSFIGSRVRTTCWDPVGSPGKWSSQGYFRNIYLTT
jgi:hypothetical protein